MRRAYKVRSYPTTGQASGAAQCLRAHQRMYNAALEERREAWKRRKVSIRYVSSPPSSATFARSTQTRRAGRSHPSRPRCGVSARRWPRSTGAARLGRRPGTRGSGHSIGGIRLRGPRTGTGAGGSRGLAGCTSRASGTSKCAPTAPPNARLRRSPSSGRAAAGSWCCPVMTSPHGRSQRPAVRSVLMSGWSGSPLPATARSSPARGSPGSLQMNWQPRSRRLPARSADRPTGGGRGRRSPRCTAGSRDGRRRLPPQNRAGTRPHLRCDRARRPAGPIPGIRPSSRPGSPRCPPPEPGGPSGGPRASGRTGGPGPPARYRRA